MKTKWRISFLLLLPILVALTYWNYLNRVYDWDMPGYLGCMFTSEFPESPGKVKDLTYYFIKQEAPKDHYNDINGTVPYDKPRQYFTQNTQSFSEQLPYFQIKVGYIWAITVLYKLGFTPPMSVLFLSLLSYFICGVLLFYILKIIFPQNYIIAFLVTLGVMVLPPMTYMSRISTPDIFILQFLLIFMIALFRNWGKWVIFCLLFVITFIRPDYITFTLTYLATTFVYLYLKTKKIDFEIVFQGAVLLFVYMGIIKYYNYPGWHDLFYDTFISRRPIISLQKPDFSLNDYLMILFVKIIYFKRITLAALICLGAVFYLSKDKRIRIYTLFIFVNIYIKFVFFPHSSSVRFFFGFILLLVIMALYALSKKYNGFRLDKNV